jgi:hypothetical protein
MNPARWSYTAALLASRFSVSLVKIIGVDIAPNGRAGLGVGILVIAANKSSAAGLWGLRRPWRAGTDPRNVKARWRRSAQR